MKKNIDDLTQKIEQKQITYEKMEKDKEENEKKFKAMEAFMKANFKPDLIELYKQQCAN